MVLQGVAAGKTGLGKLSSIEGNSTGYDLTDTKACQKAMAAGDKEN